MVFITDTFLAEQKKIRKAKNNYSSYCKDVDERLRSMTFDDFYNKEFHVTGDPSRVTKVRVNDTGSKSGSSGGYRVYSWCIPFTDVEGKMVQPIDGHVYLLGVHPKKGPEGIKQYGDKFILHLVSECSKQISSSTCTSMPNPIC